MPEPHRSRYRFLMKRYLDHGQECILGQTREVPARRRDGRVFPAELTVGELRVEGERRFVGVIRDVSERKEQDVRVRESLARFQEIAERIQDIFYIAVPSLGRVLYVSPAFNADLRPFARRGRDGTTVVAALGPSRGSRTRAGGARARRARDWSSTRSTASFDPTASSAWCATAAFR